MPFSWITERTVCRFCPRLSDLFSPKLFYLSALDYWMFLFWTIGWFYPGPLVGFVLSFDVLSLTILVFL